MNTVVNWILSNGSDEFGLPDSIFEQYNREQRPDGQSFIPARLFMYVIGRGFDDLLLPPKHMACSNRGIKRQVSLSDR